MLSAVQSQPVSCIQGVDKCKMCTAGSALPLNESKRRHLPCVSSALTSLPFYFGIHCSWEAQGQFAPISPA